METRKPLKTTILFIGIFLVGIILVILFIHKALETEQFMHSSQEINSKVENVSQSNV